MASKTKKIVVAHSYAEAFQSAILGSVLTSAQVKSDSHVASEGTREVIRKAIIALYGACGGNAKAYDDAVASVLGNGEKGKAHLPGTLAAQIPEAQRLSMRVTLSEARALARWASTATNNAKLASLTFKHAMAARKAETPKAVAAEKATHDERKATAAASLEQMIAAAGIPFTFKVLAKILGADKSTKTFAATCEALAFQTA